MPSARRPLVRTLLGATLVALVPTGGLLIAPPSQALTTSRALTTTSQAPTTTAGSRPPLLFGVSAANRTQILEHETALGRPMGGVRVFRRWGEPLFGPDLTWARDGGRSLFISIKSRRRDGSGISYRDLASATAGSPLHADLLGQAAQVRAFGGTVYLTYQHEPEADPTLGTGAEFAAAWRRLVRVYREAGVTNARFVWTVTGHGFIRTDARSARHYWPGQDYVDRIGVDVYNFYRCSNPRGRWQSPAAKLAPVLAFAGRHPTKPVVLMEWSSAEDPGRAGRKGGWIADLSRLLRRPEYRQVVAVLQWSGRNHGPNPCPLDYLSSTTSLAALRAMAADPMFAAGVARTRPSAPNRWSSPS